MPDPTKETISATMIEDELCNVLEALNMEHGEGYLRRS